MMALSVSLAMIAGDKLSAGTKVFLQKRANTQIESPTFKHRPAAKAKSVNGVEYINCFIALDGATISELESMGVQVTGEYDQFVTAKIPVNKLDAVSELKGVKQVAIAKMKRHFTDQAANVTNALKAWDGTNYGLLDAYTGKDVVVGMIDIGIEFNHRAFKDANGNTRVKRVYLPSATSANGGSRPSIGGTTLSGYHYTTASQIAALTTDYTEESHGTHTSGCATGSKVGVYSGMAPDCDIVLCGLGEAGDDATILNCAKYIAEYAKSVGKPCVISISLGGTVGPHDGKSTISMGYDEIAQEYGAIILLAAGNEADKTGYATKTLSSNTDEMVVYPSLTSSLNGYSLAHWSGFYNSTSDELKINMMIVNRNGQVQWQSGALSSASYASNASQLSSYFSSLVQNGEDYGGISWAGAVDPNSGRYYIELDAFVGSATTTGNKLVFVVTGKAGNVITAWSDCQYSQFATSATISGHTLTPGQYVNSMSDDICGSKTISVGAAATRLTVPYNYGSSTGSFDNAYPEGDIAEFSSYGTDYNGVNHPFITAPGFAVVSSLNRYDESGYISANYVSYRQSQGSYYDYWGYMSGTSMATPISAGVVALYLQADPTLDVDGVKDVIAHSATAYTNPQSPAMQRGYGIINALAGIEYIEENADPVPTIKVNPNELSFSTGVGQSASKSFTVSGRNLEGRVNLTLNDPNGVFTLSQAYINQSTLASGDKDIAVTFNSATEGNFTATVTLSSTNAESKTVTLTASAHDGGTASDAYLDIAKYATIDDAGWQSNNVSGLTNFYKYTEYASDGVAWLTLPVYGAWTGVYYNNNPQKWIKSNVNTASGVNGQGSWNAVNNNIYLGYSSYFDNTTNSKYFGPYSSTSTNPTSTTERTITFYVTNTTEVKLYGVNNNNATTGNGNNRKYYYTSLYVYECQDDGNGNLIEGTTAVNGNNHRSATNSSTINFDVTGLDAAKIYKVQATVIRGKLYEIGFCTPLPEPGLPIITHVEPTTTTADVTWLPSENNDSWNLRYRPYVETTSPTNYFWDFEDIDQLTGWISADIDGDNHSWGRYGGEGLLVQSGEHAMLSEGYDFDNNAWLSPNNWLITPQVQLGGELSFYAGTQYDQYGTGPVAVYISQNETISSITDFVQVGSDVTVTNGVMTQYTFDLSAYSGSGYIAIVHHNDTRTPYLNIDDVRVTVPGGVDPPAWTRVDNVTSPYTIEGLTPATTYEVQVMGENQYYYGFWTESTLFTTLPEVTEATLATIEGSGTKGELYTISDALVAVYADADLGLLWCKDQGNASINSTSMLDGQIDFMNDETLTGTTGQNGRAWDQSNWVVLKFPKSDQENRVAALLNGAVEGNKVIAAKTVTGRYIDDANYTIEVQPVNGAYTLTFDGSASYVKNVYCVANFLESNTNYGSNTGAVGVHGDHYFFMNPKIQEICHITYAMWDGEMFTTPSNTEIPGAFTVGWGFNTTGGVAPTLESGETYQFDAIVAHPATRGGMLRGEGTLSDNYVVYPTNLTGSGNIITAINGIYMDGSREVVGVEYVNSLGQVGKRPFSGVNIVVTRYSDGTTTTAKKVFK